MPLSPVAAIRAHCSECLPEPKGEYLRCPTVDCPCWRFRTGNINRAGQGHFARLHDAHSRAGISPKTSAFAAARAKILATDSEARLAGKWHFTSPEWWPYGELDYRPGERAVRAIARKCRDCMGDLRPADCCSPGCAIFPYRYGRRPRAKDRGGDA